MQHMTFGVQPTIPSAIETTITGSHQHLWYPPVASDTLALRLCQLCGRAQKLERHKNYKFSDAWIDVLEPGEKEANVENP